MNSFNFIEKEKNFEENLFNFEEKLKNLVFIKSSSQNRIFERKKH